MAITVEQFAAMRSALQSRMSLLSSGKAKTRRPARLLRLPVRHRLPEHRLRRRPFQRPRPPGRRHLRSLPELSPPQW